jgi:multiple sugar transport system permease protein
MRRKNTESIPGMLFASPWILGFLLLVAWPFVASLYWSFTHYDLISSPTWTGGENYQRIVREFKTGQGVGQAAYNTFYYAIVSVPLSIVLGIALAVMLSQPVKGSGIYRTIFYLPSVIPVVAASVLWIWLLDPQDGLINYALSWIGLPAQNWLTQSREAISVDTAQTIGGWTRGENPLLIFGSKDALVLMALWGVGNWMVIYLAALGDIPKSLHEAAQIDGAGPLKRFQVVTLPLLTPIIFFNLVMGIIRSVQSFTLIYIVSEGTGGADGSMLMISLHLFLSAFSDLDMGYASAIAWILLLLLAGCTLMLFRSARYWVHYRVAN